MSTSSEEESNNQNSKQNKISKQNKNFIKFQPKIILLGDSTVGKTSILERYTNNNFNLHNTLTIGVDLRVTQHMVGDNKNMKLKIWDTSGQERFRAIAENFYKGAHGVCLVFDLNNKKTFEQINFWVNQICEKSENTNIVKCLIGNKTDLEQKVKEEEIIDLCDNNSLKYFRTSAKKGEGIDQVFDYMAKQCYNVFGAKFEEEQKRKSIQKQQDEDKQQNQQREKQGKTIKKLGQKKLKKQNSNGGSGGCC